MLNSCGLFFQNVARLHREKSLADSTIIELREKLQNFEVCDALYINKGFT